jgi:hypothetical protein
MIMIRKLNIKRIWILSIIMIAVYLCAGAASAVVDASDESADWAGWAAWTEQVFAAEVTYSDSDSETISVTSDTYVIKGYYPEKHTNSSGFTVKEGSSTKNALP